MTAEIVIVNRQGIAIAADSAVTTGRNRVWKSANKLFSLSPNNDIGIMIYNTGDYAGFPWEVVIKEFRRGLNGRVFDYVYECEEAFVEFLKEERFLTASQGVSHVLLILMNFISQFRKRYTYRSRAEMQTHLTAYLAEIDQRIMQMNPLADVIPQNIFNRTLRTSIQSVARSDLGYALTRPSLDALQNTLYGLVSNDFDSIYMTGVVFAGYGKKQLLPYTSHYVVDGRLDYIRPRARQSVFLRCWRRSIDDFNTNEDLPAIIIPYAQSDMFYLFMEGIMLKSLKYLQNTIRKTLSDKSDDLIAAYVPAVQQIVERNLQSQQNNAITAEIGRQFQEFRQVEYVNPILDVVQSLPKEEMSAMAEALVELTSLRRRVGSPLESVGGPTDVAFISKGDGFIWIKRKHYFNIDLNRDFMVRRRM